jgi:hypothetical protein
MIKYNKVYIIKTKMNFAHLKQIKLSYKTHFIEAMKYSYETQKASFYFFIHAFYPDAFVNDGSKIIKNLHNKFEKRDDILDKNLCFKLDKNLTDTKV